MATGLNLQWLQQYFVGIPDEGPTYGTVVWPFRPSPQHLISPITVTPQAWPYPVEMDPKVPDGGVSVPRALVPQHDTCRSSLTPQLAPSPDETSMNRPPGAV